MANLTTRLVIIVFSALIALLLGFSYKFSSTAVTQEIERNVTQTASLLQNLLDYRLGSLRSNQNSQSHSFTLSRLVKAEDRQRLENYFLSLDQSDIKITPDFRFISRSNTLFWDDGNAPFFGISNTHLSQIMDEVSYSDSWHFVLLEIESVDRHLLIRRMPILDPDSGEVLGKLFISLVLNNNFALVESLKLTSNTREVVLLANDKPVASTVKLDRELLIRIQESQDPSLEFDSSLVANHIDLKIDGVASPISLYSLQENKSFLALEDNFKISLLFSIVSIIFTALLARVLVQRRVTSELTALMSYAQQAKEDRKVPKFEGSIVYEFDHIGNTLEHTFAELLEKEKLFQDLFSFALSPILVWNSEGRVLRMNPAAEKAFQRDGVHIERDFQSFQMRIIDHIRMVSTGAVLTGINIPISKTAYLWNLSPISLDDEIQTIIGQGLDITALVEAERQSNIARVEAEKSAIARAEFMARVSHEIRTPLNGILGISQLLKKATHSVDQAEKIDVLCDSGEHLLAVLNDILDFSKIEQGKLKIENKEFLLSSLANSIENIYSPLCDEKHIRLSMRNHAPEGTRIISDQVRLNQVLFNLLSNSVKFTHTGQVEVVFSLAELVDQRSILSIKVCDTGIGISEDNLQNIFDPFIQSEKTSIREYGGSGLGLSIVKLLVDMLEGEISIESKEHTGTDITIKLPVKVSLDVSSELNTKKNPRVTVALFDRPHSMLLVEDNKTNAFIAKAFCEKYGMQVEWVKDGAAAIDALNIRNYDLIMMDNQMPNMDGIEATQLIRNDLKIATPIIACTADGFKETKQAFITAGANYVLVKPIKEGPLYEALFYYKEEFVNRVGNQSANTTITKD